MIRKPEAKDRAELLMRELSNDGCALKRGRALDIVAKLEGCRDWNTFCAVAPEIQQMAGTGPEYAVGSLVKAANFGRVDSVCLAALLKHSSPEDSTVLYRWESPEGEKFELRLSGTAMFGVMEPETGHLVYHSSANGLTQAFIQAWEHSRQQDNPEFLRRPCLQWFNEAGRLVVDLFVPLSVNVMDEVRQFERMMSKPKDFGNDFLVDLHLNGVSHQEVVKEEPLGSLTYTIGDISHLATDGHVSDLKMVAYLRHSRRDESTSLFNWTAPEGRQYTLRVFGYARIKLLESDGVCREYSSAKGLAAEFLAALDTYYEYDEHAHELLNWPYYEWICDSGDQVGGVFDALNVDVSQELDRLKRILSNS